MQCLCCCCTERRVKKKKEKAESSEQEESSKSKQDKSGRKQDEKFDRKQDEKFDRKQDEKFVRKQDESVEKRTRVEIPKYNIRSKRSSIWKLTEKSSSSQLFLPVQEIDTETLIYHLNIPLSDEHKKASIFNIVDSKRQHLALENIFGLYMNQSRFSGKKLRSTTMNIKVLRSFDDIIYLYQQFAIRNVNEDRTLSCKDTFRNKLFDALFYKTSKSYQQTSHTADARLKFDVIAGDTKWLKLMSWWKLFNKSFVPNCKKLHKCLKENRDKQLNEEHSVTQLQNELHNLLNNLNMINLPVEISAIQAYVYLPRKLPDIESWSIYQENAIDDLEENFPQTTSQDYLWRYFLRECSYFSLNLLFRVVRYITESNEIKMLSIETIVKSHIAIFFIRRVTIYLAEDMNEDYINTLTGSSLKMLEKFLTDINVKKNHGACDFEIIASICSRLLSTHMALIVKKFQRPFGDSSTVITKEIISKYLVDVETNGIIFAIKALQNDLLSCKFLLKLNDEEMCLADEDISMGRSLKFAYIITACYKIVNGNDAMMFPLLSNYIQHDFVAFLSDVQTELSIMPHAEISLVDFILKVRVFQDDLLQKFRKSLNNINKIVNNGKILLYKEITPMK